VPKPAATRRLHASTQALTTAIEHELQFARHLKKQRGSDLWRVTIVDLETEQPGSRAMLTVTFEIGELQSGELFVSQWSISGPDVPRSRASRVPLHTYSRAALYAVEHAIANGRGSTRYEIDRNGRIIDPRAGERPERPRKRHVYPKDETRVARAAELYREAYERGSRSPTADVARELNVGRSTAARAIADARKKGLLGSALANRAGEARPPKKKR
jgi:hypothetical protein